MAQRKATVENRKALQYHFRYLSTLKKCIHCPHCQDLVLPKSFEKHCSEHHNINTKLSCVWCFGAVSWKSLCKSMNADHLFQCSRQFLRMNGAPTPPSAFDRTPLCLEKDLFGRTHDAQPRAYEPVWPLPLSPAPLMYDIESLNLAVSCVRTYLERKEDMFWCHMIVRGIAFQSFLAAMDADEGRTRTLPFFCWCDGGKLQEERHRRHRHMIVVSPSRDHFDKNILKKIRVSSEDRPDRRIRCFHTEPIQSALHVVHTLGYVSRRESVCEFSGNPPNSPKQANHIYIYCSLPRDYKLPMVLEWPDGVRDLLSLESRNMKWGELMRANTSFVDGKWSIQVETIPGIAFGKPLPLTRNFHPCDQPTPYFHHLVDGEKQYFKRLNKACGTWVFYYDVIQQRRLILRPFHQRLLHEFKPLVSRNAELEIDNTRLKKDSEMTLYMRTQLEEATTEKMNFKKQLEDATTEKMNFKKQLDEVNAENKTLHGKIHEFHDGEIVRLKTELDECRKQKAELENELAKTKKLRVQSK